MNNKPVLVSIAIGLILLGAIIGVSFLLTPANPPGAPNTEGSSTPATNTPSSSTLARATIEDVDASQVRLDTNSPVQIRIANTGPIPFSQERIDLKMGRDFFLIGYQERSYTMAYSELIEPGSNHTFTMYFNIPSHYSGVPLAGTYNAEARLYVNDVFMDDWRGTVALS